MQTKLAAAAVAFRGALLHENRYHLSSMAARTQDLECVRQRFTMSHHTMQGQSHSEEPGKFASFVHVTNHSLIKAQRIKEKEFVRTDYLPCKPLPPLSQKYLMHVLSKNMLVSAVECNCRQMLIKDSKSNLHSPRSLRFIYPSSAFPFQFH